MKNKEIIQTTPLSGADVMERVEGSLAGKGNAYLISALIMLGIPFVLMVVFLLNGMDRSDVFNIHLVFMILFGPVWLILMIAFLRGRSDEKKVPSHLIFRRYGGPAGVAAVINAANYQIVYEDKHHQFRLTPTYIMKPGDYSTFMPLSHIRLACKEDRRSAAVLALFVSPLLAAAVSKGKTSGLFLSAYNCYGDQNDYRFTNELTGGSAEIDRIIQMIPGYAPHCAIGDSPDTRAYLAMNTIMPPM